MPIMIFLESELILLLPEKDHYAMHQTGPHSIGNQSLEMEEKSKTLKKDSEKVKSPIQILLLLDQTKVSLVSILLSQNSMKVIKPLWNAHPHSLMVELILFHLWVISQFLFTLISFLKLKCLHAVLLHTLKIFKFSFNHIPLLCNPINVSSSDHMKNKEVETLISFWQQFQRMAEDNFLLNTTKLMIKIKNGIIPKRPDKSITLLIQIWE